MRERMARPRHSRMVEDADDVVCMIGSRVAPAGITDWRLFSRRIKYRPRHLCIRMPSGLWQFVGMRTPSRQREKKGKK